MTTTHTQPAGCDLDSLEALARAATPGPWAYQEDSDAYTHIVRPVASPGWIIASATQTSKPEGEANGRWIAAANPTTVLSLIAAARAAQAPQIAQHAETIEQYVPPQAEILADEAKLYRDLTGDAMALGFDGVPAALEALRTVRSQAPQGDTRQGDAVVEPSPPTRGTRVARDADGNYFSQGDVMRIADGIRPGDGWSGEDWDYVLANAVANELARRFRAQGGNASVESTGAAHTCTPADERALPPLPAQHDELRARWKCEDCDGTGEVGDPIDQGYFQPPERARCSNCDGAGQVPITAYTDDQMREYARAAQGAGTAPVDGSFEDLRNVLEMVRQSMALSRFEKARGQVNHAIFLLKSLVATPPAIAAQSAGTAPTLAPCEGGPILPDSCSDCRREGGLCELVATPPAPVSTVAATTASASIDADPEFQRLAEAWRAEPYGTRAFLTTWDALVAFIDSRAADGQQGASRAVLDPVQVDAIARKYVGLGGVEDYRAFANDIAALARNLPAQGEQCTNGPTCYCPDRHASAPLPAQADGQAVDDARDAAKGGA